MTISATCSACGKRLSGPDSAVGRKVKCPKCGQVVQFPGGDAADEAAGRAKPSNSSTADLAAALAGKSESKEAKAPPAAPEGESGLALKDASAEEPSPPPLAPTSGSRRSSTTMSRMLARSSPYKTLRLLGIIIFGTGIVIAALVFLGGLAGLIVGSMAGLHPALAVGMFVGALVLAAVVLLVGKATSELIRLWADVGDRARHLTMMLEETLAQQRPNDVGGGSR
jgi:phage FluMu protein Com